MNDNEKASVAILADILQEIIVALNCRELSQDQAQQLTSQLQEAKLTFVL